MGGAGGGGMPDMASMMKMLQGGGGGGGGGMPNMGGMDMSKMVRLGSVKHTKYLWIIC